MSANTKARGLYDKYSVEKKEGDTDPDADYFVLRLDTDPHAREAVRAYIESVKEDDPVLAANLRAWLESIR